MKTLDQIMLKYRTDKSSPYHNYTPVYDKWFTPFRDKPITLLELGIGFIESENREGESILGFREYFSNGNCYALDKDPKNLPDTFVCDQTDRIGLIEVLSKIGNPDIIIDDASHIQRKTIESLDILFPYLKSGGLYCIEDLQTAYFPSWGGDETIFNFNKETVMNYFFKVCHYLNLKKQHTFQIPPNIVVPIIYRDIKAISFYHGQIIVQKV